jgi:urea transport system ATP-binding protein
MQSDEDLILKINSVSAVFEGFCALTEVDVSVERNTVRFFIGPNGAGKTTLLDVICEKTTPTSGTVSFFPKGRPPVRLTGLKEHQISNLGVGRKFQVPSVFVNLTVMDNMVLSLKGRKGVFDSLFGHMAKSEEESIEFNLERVGLIHRKDALAGALAHGEKQWLELAMQFVSKPELIMLDEPAAGMGKAETEKTGEILVEMKKECSIIVVEHDMEFVKQIADKVTVLHEGKVLMEGTVHDVLADSAVKAVYLGRGGER